MASRKSERCVAQPNQPAARPLTAAYYLSFVNLGLILAVLGPTLPYLAEQTGTQLSQVSILFSARAFGAISGALLSGRLYDQRAGNRLVALALLTFAVSLALIPVVPLLWLLALLLFFIGLAEGGLDVGVNTMIVWLYGRRVGPYMNGLHFFFGLGAFLAPVIVAQALLLSGGVRWSFWVLAALVLPALLWILRLPSPQPPARDNAVASAPPAQPALVFLSALILALYVGAEASFSGWIFSYAVALGLATEAVAAILTSVFWGAFTIGRLLSIPLAARLRPRTILVGDLLGAALGAALLLVWRDFQPAVWLGTALAGLCMASIFPTVLTLAERRMAITGKVTSAFFVGANLGAMTLPWLIGQLFTAVSPAATMVAILVDLAAALLVLALLLRLGPRDAPA